MKKVELKPGKLGAITNSQIKNGMCFYYRHNHFWMFADARLIWRDLERKIHADWRNLVDPKEWWEEPFV